MYGSPEAKIPDVPSPSSSPIATLDGILQIVIDSAEQGDWDHLDEIAGKLLPALGAVTEKQHMASLSAAGKARISELLLKLQTAIDRCAVRKTQISPLLDALSATKSIADKK